MKKFLSLIVLLFTVLAVNAQMATVTIPVGQTYKAVTTSYTLTNTTAAYLQINAAQNYPTTQDFLCHLDSLTGNHTYIAVALWGQKFSTSAWTAIGSAVTWKGTTASHDTTIVLSNASAVRYRNYKVTYTPTGTGTSAITLQEMKLYY